MIKDIINQILLGLGACAFGVAAVVYGVRFFLDETRGNIPICLLFLVGCMILTISCIVVTLTNAKKYKNKKDDKT